MKKVTFILLIFAVLTHIPLFSQQKENVTKELQTSLKKSFNDYEKKHGNYLKTNNVRMHYMTWGNPKGNPLIWIHGTYSNSYELLDIVDLLVNKGLYVIAIDYYGHGQTPVPNKEVSLYDITDDINNLMTNLNIDRAIIGGWSRGGSIATAFYDAYPSKVKALILEDGGSVGWDEPNHKEKIDDYKNDINSYFENYKEPTEYKSELDAYSDIFTKNKIKNKSEIESNKRKLFTKISSLQKIESEKFQFNPLVAKLICEDSAENYLTAVYRTFQSNTLFGMSSHLLYPKIIYRNLNVPMLIFDPIGKNDWFDFNQGNKELVKMHPDLITLKVYDETGHGVKHQHPKRFVKDVLAFIKNL